MSVPSVLPSCSNRPLPSFHQQTFTLCIGVRCSKSHFQTNIVLLCNHFHLSFCVYIFSLLGLLLLNRVIFFLQNIHVLDLFLMQRIKILNDTPSLTLIPGKSSHSAFHCSNCQVLASRQLSTKLLSVKMSVCSYMTLCI